MTEWLRNKILPDAVHAKAFGPDIQHFVGFEPNSRKNIDHYLADIVFGDVILETTTGLTVKKSVVIKMQPERDLFSPIADTSHHLRNELFFYTDLIPFLRKYDTSDFFSKNVPEFVYGMASVENPQEDVIIFKNMNKKGFRMTEERLFLDEKHIELALTRLATFHAISFKCQQQDPAGFNSVVSKISRGASKNQAPTPDGKPSWTSLNLRGIDPLKNDQKYKDRICDIYKHFENGVLGFKKYLNPSESKGVLMHGDFTRNNLLYKYNSNGQPEEVIFVDWCTYKHSSSFAIDLSTLLMVNTSPEMKRLRWDECLRTYHDVLLRQLAGYPTAPSLEEIELEVRERGVWGYYISALLIPAALGAGEKEAIGPENFFQYFMESGGEKGTYYLVENVKFMLDRHFIFED